MMWLSRRKSQVNIGQVGRHERRIIDSASVRRAYDDDQRPLGVGPGVVRGRSPLTPSGVVYSVFKKIKTPKSRPRVLEGLDAPAAQTKIVLQPAQTSYRHLAHIVHSDQD